MTRTLTLPVNGKDYTIPAPSMRVLKVCGAVSAIRTARDKDAPIPAAAARVIELYNTSGRDLEQDVLGEAWEQMFDDGVPNEDYQRVVRAAIGWALHGDDDKARAVAAGDEPDGGGSGPKASTTTAAASTTKPPASTSGTTSRRKKSSA